MSLPIDNPTFWHADTAHIAVNPHRPHDADGLAEFAASSDETRSLLYFQTSGSEGAPKWVGLSRAAFLHSARTVNAHLESTAQDRWLIALPLFHVGGFAILARCHESGASFRRMEEKWSPERFVALCRQENITLASLVPTQVYDLAKAKLEAPGGLRAVIVGGGALPLLIPVTGPATVGLDTPQNLQMVTVSGSAPVVLRNESYAQQAIELGWPLLQSYGMTEACSQIATEPLAHLHAGFDPFTLEVLPGWNLETDRQGVLYLRGPALASGYAVRRDWRHRTWLDEDSKLTAVHAPEGHHLWMWEPLDPASGLITRDHVQLWWHGNRQFLRFLARGSSFVKVLGELVNLAALQPRLSGLAVSMGLGFDNVVIVPLPHDRMGSRLVLVGEPPRVNLECLREQFNKQVVSVEKLDECREVKALPRTDLGKLDMPALKILLQEGQTRKG